MEDSSVDLKYDATLLIKIYTNIFSICIEFCKYLSYNYIDILQKLHRYIWGYMYSCGFLRCLKEELVWKF